MLQRVCDGPTALLAMGSRPRREEGRPAKTPPARRVSWESKNVGNLDVTIQGKRREPGPLGGKCAGRETRSAGAGRRGAPTRSPGPPTPATVPGAFPLALVHNRFALPAGAVLASGRRR